MQFDWIGEDKAAKSDVDLMKLINAQKTYISTLEKGKIFRNKLIEGYEETIRLQEKRIELLENRNRLIERYEVTIDLLEKQNKKLVEIIEDYKMTIEGLQSEIDASYKDDIHIKE